jgi:serine/threonine protein kinase
VDPERWRRVEEILGAALELPPEERRSFAERASRGDGELLAEVLSLLAADAGAGAFLGRPLLSPTGEPPAEEEEPAWIGRTIGPYRLVRRLGEGGMSAVYLAVRSEEQFQQQVAVKLIRAGVAGAEQLRRFRTERQILARLNHPGIARLFDGGTTPEGLPYFVLEYVDGEPIDRYCDRRRLSVAERLGLFRTVCEAVHYAHQNLVVHRDLKPGNILVTAEGVPKLLDFGIAKPLPPEPAAAGAAPTAAWLRLLTPEYASPEQIQGKPVTTATDVYSLGVLLYKLLTGHLPYRLEERTPQAIERAILEREPIRPSAAVGRGADAGSPDAAGSARAEAEAVSGLRGVRPRQLRRQLAGDLDNMVLKALRKEPQRRYGSVEQFSEDVRRHLERRPVEAHPSSLAYRTRKFLRRSRLALGVAAAFVLVLVAALVLLALQSVRAAERERDHAREVARFLEEVFCSDRPAAVAAEAGPEGEVQAALRQTLDRILRDLGDLDRAETLLGLGRCLGAAGRRREAEPLLVEALAVRRRMLPGGHPAVAEAQRALEECRRARP